MESQKLMQYVSESPGWANFNAEVYFSVICYEIARRDAIIAKLQAMHSTPTPFAIVATR